MSTSVAIPDYSNPEPILEKTCKKCNHKLYQHAFIDKYDYYVHSHYYSVSQCVLCSCTEFEEEDE